MIFLVGMPASGKSTVGVELAKELDIEFIDLDKLIEYREGKTIPEIFQQQGEGHFRDREHFHLMQLLAENKKQVVATGGGTPCFNHNMAQMLAKGVVFYLSAAAEHLYARHASDVHERPLFAGLSELEVRDTMHSLFMEREAYFKQAHHVILTDNKTPREIAAEIRTKL